MKTIFTVDVEDWYQTHDYNLHPNTWNNYEDRVEIGTNMLLDILEKHNVKAVFFVLGYIAAKHPRLIRKIAEAGHEIGSHSYWHKKLYEMKKEEFRTDLRLSKDVLEDIIGKKILYFRTPSWTYNNSTTFLFDVLEEEGFICDSSIQPFKTPLSGLKGIPLEPFYPIIDGVRKKIIEFPPTVFNVGGIRIPFSGGFYLRQFPTVLINGMLKNTLNKRHALTYVHRWELDYEQPKLKQSFLINYLHGNGIKNNKSKLEEILKNNEFSSLANLIEGGNFPCYSLKSE